MQNWEIPNDPGKRARFSINNFLSGCFSVALPQRCDQHRFHAGCPWCNWESNLDPICDGRQAQPGGGSMRFDINSFEILQLIIQGRLVCWTQTGEFNVQKIRFLKFEWCLMIWLSGVNTSELLHNVILKAPSLNGSFKQRSTRWMNLGLFGLC